MTVTRDFLLPDLGEGLTEAELVRWLVAVGDSVAVDQPVVEVETAKAVVEVPSPFAGIVAVLHGQPGQTLDVGRPLISIAEAGSGGEEYRTEERAGTKVLATASASAPGSASGSASAGSAAGSGSGNVLIGYGTSGSATGGRTRRRKGRETPQNGRQSGSASASAPSEATRVVSPIVRKLARDHGISLRSIAGSGPDGLILRRDVERAAQGQLPAGRAQLPAGQAPIVAPIAAGEADAQTGLGVASRTPMRGVRRAVAQAMTRSRSEIPEATVWVDADAT
ncbi:MAG TPA: biotin/lipoyl-containing protein, partial [Sinomonas sp.]|nr:biotin/lipoyl-containing protein [Sinomonas sp.]